MALLLTLFIFAFLSANPAVANAHGMSHQILKKDAIVIAAEYDDGEPVSYAEAKVFSPSGGKIEHQNGRTDKNGRFAFIPDCPGEWKVSIDAGMGHLLEAVFPVDKDMNIDNRTVQSDRALSKWQGVITGLGVIFGLLGCLYYFKARRTPPELLARNPRQR